MVLDEVESTAGIHNHDCITGSPRSAGGGGGDDDSWSNELLRRGWDLTRKATIAAAAATAAPPLIVISAAGVALSVPFAAYLASLAATNHLMGALLRSCQPPSQPYSREDDDDVLEQEFLDASEGYGQDAPAFGHLDTETEQGVVEEENVSDTSLPLSRDPGVSKATAPAFAGDEVQGEFSAQESGQGSYTSNSGDALLPVSRDPGVSEEPAPAFAGDQVEEEEEVEGEISAQESGQDSYTSNRRDETEERTPMEALPRGLGVAALAKPLFSEEDSVVQKKGGGEFSVLNSNQQLLQSNNWFDKEDGLYSKNNEDDDRTMEENKSAKETVPQGFYFPESRVPATGDDDSVVQEKGEDEFSVQNSGQQQSFQFESRNFGEKEEDGKTMEENKPSTVLQQTPAFAYFDTETEQAIIKEEEESDTSLLLSQDPGVSEASAPAFAVDEVEEEVQGEFSAQTSGQDSYTSNHGDDAEYTPMEGIGSAQKETLLGGFGVSASAKPLFPEEHNVAQEKGNGEEAVQVSGQQSFQSNIWNKKEDDVYSKKEEGDGKPVEKNTSMEETVSKGFCFPRSRVPPLGEADGNVVQEKEEGEFSAGKSGQQSFQTKNVSDEKQEEDGKTTEKKKSTEEMLLQGFYESCVPASNDEDHVVQEKREGEFSVQNSDQLALQSRIWNDKEEGGKTIEENKSTEPTHSQGSYFPKSSMPASGDEDNVVHEKAKGEFSVQNLGQYSLLSDIGDKKEHDITIEEKNSTEDLAPRDLVGSGSPAPVLHGEDNAVQSEEGFEVAVQGVLKEDNSKADLVMDEAVDAQVEIIATAAPESEVLPLSTALVMAEVVDVQVEIIATAAPDTEALSPSNLVARELLPDLVTGEVNCEYVATVAVAEPESEVLHESNPAVCASMADLGTGDGKPMEENKPTTVSQEAPVFAYFDIETEQAIIKEEKESDTLLLLSQDPGVSEASAPAFAVVEVEEEVQGEFSDQTSGQDSYTTMEGRGSTQKEMLPGGFGVSASAKSLFPEEHNVAQEKGNGEEAVQVSGQQSFQSDIWNEKEDDVYPKREEGDGKSIGENKSMEETVSQGLPPSGKADDYVVQEKEDGEFSAGILVQQPFQTKNGSDEKEEEDGKTTEENKSTEETLLQGFYESCVPASDDEDNVVQEKREGEFSVQNSDQLPVQSKIWNDKEEEGKTIEENKSTEPKHSQGSYFVKSSVPASGDEDNVVNEKAKGEFSVQNLGQYSLLSDIGDKKEHDITLEEKKSTEELAPRDFIGSGSPAPVLHGDDNAVQRKEGFEVAAQGILEEANSNTDLVLSEVVDVQVIIANVAPQSEVLPPGTDLVMAEVADAQVEIISTAAPESEVLPPGTDLVIAEVVDVQVEIIPTAAPDSEALSPSNLVARELHPDLVTGEVNDVYVASVASAEPEGNLLHESNLVVCASTEDLGTGEISDVQVNVAAAAKPEDEALQLSNLASCESQAVVETAHIGDIIGIATMEDIVRNVGDVNKEDMECCLVPVASMHDTEDVISSGSTQYFSTMGDEIIDLPDQSSDVGYTVMNEAIGGRVVAHGEAHYTEEQLREQLDTIRTITGYDAAPSSTLEGELAGLYIFVGVEPPVGSSDSSDRLMELSAKLWFLKSIIGVD